MNEKLNKIKELLGSLLPENEEIKMEATTTDKGVIYTDAIEVGKTVEVADENGENRTPAEDGNYILEDGRTIVIADGKITEIIEKEEEETEPEETEPTDFEKQVIKFSESYGEKTRKIAIAVLGDNPNGYIVEAGDDYAVAEIWNEELGRGIYMKYPITWNGDEPVAGEGTEVVYTFVEKTEEEPETTVEETVVEENMEETPVEEPTEEEPTEEPDETEKAIADLTKRVEEIEKVLAELKDEKPETVEETFENLTAKENSKSMAVRYAEAMRR